MLFDCYLSKMREVSACLQRAYKVAMLSWFGYTKRLAFAICSGWPSEIQCSVVTCTRRSSPPEPSCKIQADPLRSGGTNAKTLRPPTSSIGKWQDMTMLARAARGSCTSLWCSFARRSQRQCRHRTQGTQRRPTSDMHHRQLCRKKAVG